MKHIIEFPLDDGDSVLIEVDEAASTDDRISIGEQVSQTAQQSFESALEKVKPVADTIMSKVRNLNDPADEVEVQFGIKMSAELGAVIASGNAEVNYQINLKWKKNK
ncbi:hypothetical protein NIES267_72120 (plasmid) [Calothrix parasitica NIES-267]|uniref:Trypsin-co-occurring domain-containing protein n=1 Tax=Calothrix parasitica NIES-267 TaxID=1973488 RepID=A0A1Z4M2T5_9CYAN|nr:hypothetical protein NIES267_72120 [Calothrix parasitica NIES-267]